MTYEHFLFSTLILIILSDHQPDLTAEPYDILYERYVEKWYNQFIEYDNTHDTKQGLYDTMLQWIMNNPEIVPPTE